MRSDRVKKGVERAPNRCLMYATGVDPIDMDKPYVGIASSFTDLVPGHVGMRELERYIERGIAAGGGVPFVFGVPAICDGIAMGHRGMHYSLPSRELIADEVETIAEAHALDGLVLLTNCDKITPGMLMAAGRLNIPTIVVTAGPMLGGQLGKERLSLVKNTFEAVGEYNAGKITLEELIKMESRACPGEGSCQGLYTANTMAILTETMGMSLVTCGTAPAVSAFARMNLIDSIQDKEYSESPQWFQNWETIGLIAWKDKNSDGFIRYSSGNALEGVKPVYAKEKGNSGERVVLNKPDLTNENEVYIDRDIIVLANPEIAKLPFWVIALVAAGGVAAALSTAAGLLITISSAISHDLLKKTFMPRITEKQELLYSRLATAFAIGVAGLFGVYPPAFVAQVVAFAFGLAASTLFPVLLLGIFSKRLNKEGAIAGMLVGLIFTAGYIIYFKFMFPELDTLDNWLFSISPEGIGFVGMLLNVSVSLIVSSLTSPPPKEVSMMVEEIRQP